MTRDEQLALIRKRCVEAHGVGSLRAFDLEATEPLPVRLADVLLAIEQKGFNSWEHHNKTVFLLCGYDGKETPKWNLRKDDLNEQSDETILFLSELLK